MATNYAFADKFRQLLKEVPDKYSLEEWQHAYRQAIFMMGMQILKRFESEAIAEQSRHERMHLRGVESAANPDVSGGGWVIQQIASRGGGPDGGGNPSILRPCPCRVFPDYPLALQPDDVVKGRERSSR
jgi:hypothetical protein